MTGYRTAAREADGSPWDNPAMVYYREGDGPAGIGSPRFSVNTGSLRLFVKDTLYSFQGLGPAIVLALSYIHSPGVSGMFGRNWRFSYESVLEESGDIISLNRESGNTLRFRRGAPFPGQSAGQPIEAVPLDGAGDRLLDYGTYWMYIIRDARILLLYDRTGGPVIRLSRIADLDNNMVNLAFNPDGTIRAVTDAAGRSVTFSYNSSRRCTAVTLPDGRSASFTYDNRQNLARATDFGGIAAAYEYDADDAIIRIQKGNGAGTVSFKYHSGAIGKHIASVTHGEGITTLYGIVTANPRHTRITDPEGGVIQYFSSNGRTTKVIDPLGNSVEFGHGTPNLTTYRDKNGNITQTEYDTRGSLVRTTLPNGAVYQYSYDTNGNLVAEMDPIGRQTRHQYDARQHIVRTDTSAGRTFSFAYDAKGQMIRITDPRGNAIAFGYDRFGNVEAVTDASGNTVTFRYDPIGLRLVSRTDARGNLWTYEYDGNDRVSAILAPDGSSARYGYSAEGVLETVTRNGVVTRYVRNPRGRVTGTSGQAADGDQYAYDRNNRLIARTDALGRRTLFGYDAASRFTSLTNRQGATTGFSYDPEGNLLRVTDENGHATLFRYGKNSFIEAITDAGGRTVLYGQDLLGRRTTVTNARGDPMTLSYSAEGDLAQKLYHGSVVAAFSHDRLGNPVLIRDPLGETRYSYSALNLIESITFRNGAIVMFAYDANGNIETVTYPNGLAVSYTYDAMDRVTSARWPGKSIAFSYDADGALIRESRSNGVDSSYRYDSRGRLTGITHGSGEAALAEIRYERDPAGNILREQGFSAMQEPVQDSGAGGVPARASYNALNQIVTADTDTWSYDPDGNLTGIAGSRAFLARYDPENRLTDVVRNGSRTSFEYGAAGPRARKSTEQGMTEYWYSPDGILLFTTGGAPGRERACIYADGYLVAMVTAGEKTLFTHADKTGNILLITDAEGAVTASYAYEPSGNILARGGVTEGNEFTWGGAFGVLDDGNGLYFMANRHYDAATGRFLQRDPVGIAGGVNQYCYCNNNPVAVIDPDGLGPKKPARPQARPGKNQTFWDAKNRFDTFVETSARSVANNPYVKKGWKLIDQYVGNTVRDKVAPYRNNNAGQTLNQVVKHMRDRNNPKVPPRPLPGCRELQRRTTNEMGRHILEGGRTVVETVSKYNPALGGVPRMINGVEVIYNATSRRDPGPVKDAALDYAKNQAEGMIKATVNAAAQGKDPTEDFSLEDHIVNEITGGE